SGGSSGGGGRGSEPENVLDGDGDDAMGGAGGGLVGSGRAEEIAAAEALGEVLDELESDLRRLSAALRGCPLEEFDLDKVVDFSPSGGSTARTKLATAALLCGSYEALMQGSLLLSTGGSGSVKDLPSPASVRVLMRLFDCRQTLLKLVRPSLPTAAQQRARKGGTGAASSGGGSGGGGGGSGGSSFSVEGESAGSGGGAGAGLPGFSATSCFGLTLYPGGMPCLGMSFVGGMLSVLNIDQPGEEDAEGDTEIDPGLADDDAAGEPPTEAVRDDLSLQRLVLETCRGHLRSLRTGTAAASTGLAVESGGGRSTRGVAASGSGGGGGGGGPQDEADAWRAGRAAMKRCTVLAPLLLKEFFRQV
ncbi:unnamed protein product, partial [Hapterophycus canaliculatus]